MIASIKNKAIKRLWEKGKGDKLPADQLTTILQQLDALDSARNVPEDIRMFPQWHAHKLKGKLKNYWAITVKGNWRIYFKFKNGKVIDLEYDDYH